MTLTSLVAVALGGPELLIVLVVILLLFGTTRLPKLARSLGQASKEFKAGVKEGDTATDAVDTERRAGGSDPSPVDKA